ncbi:unannotated protein [freshwater metagenome]|uniref:Unannotated protein n=1 Tax=freshwater metagenome TaxID=449393 RepID=A0A6J7ING2_9ZZZZ
MGDSAGFAEPGAFAPGAFAPGALARPFIFRPLPEAVAGGVAPSAAASTSDTRPFSSAAALSSVATASAFGVSTGSSAGTTFGLARGITLTFSPSCFGSRRVMELSSICETSMTSTFSLVPPSWLAVTPSFSMTRQNGQPVAIFDGAAPFEPRVSSASSTRSMLMRLPIFSSIHMRAPPAPQHMERSP